MRFSLSGFDMQARPAAALAQRLRFTDADLLADPRKVVLGIVAAQPFRIIPTYSQSEADPIRNRSPTHRQNTLQPNTCAAAWYRKTSFTFSEAIAAVRIRLWLDGIVNAPHQTRNDRKSCRPQMPIMPSVASWPNMTGSKSLRKGSSAWLKHSSSQHNRAKSS